MDASSEQQVSEGDASPDPRELIASLRVEARFARLEPDENPYKVRFYNRVADTLESVLNRAEAAEAWNARVEARGDWMLEVITSFPGGGEPWPVGVPHPSEPFSLCKILDHLKAERDKARAERAKAEAKGEKIVDDIAFLCEAVSVVYRGDDDDTLDKVLSAKNSIERRYRFDRTRMREALRKRTKRIRMPKRERYPRYPDEPGYVHPVDRLRAAGFGKKGGDS